jgi:hypothetical protein
MIRDDEKYTFIGTRESIWLFSLAGCDLNALNARCRAVRMTALFFDGFLLAIKDSCS